jgi:hypothetical protein
MDFSPLLGPMLGDDAPSVAIEIWTEPDRMVIDTRDYAAAIAKQNPNADLGPFEPGVAFVDLEAVGDESPDLLAVLGGQASADLKELADRLPDTPEGVQQRGRSFTGTASFTDLKEAMGFDPQSDARSGAAGLALNLNVDPDLLTDFYVEYFEGTDADITVDVDTDGTIQALWYDVDLSGLSPPWSTIGTSSASTSPPTISARCARRSPSLCGPRDGHPLRGGGRPACRTGPRHHGRSHRGVVGVPPQRRLLIQMEGWCDAPPSRTFCPARRHRGVAGGRHRCAGWRRSEAQGHGRNRYHGDTCQRGQAVVVKVTASCARNWQVIEAPVTVSQPQASGEGGFPLTCTGRNQTFRGRFNRSTPRSSRESPS